MTTFGYVRCSTLDQSLDIQIADLNTHGVEMIRMEKVSGTSTHNRPELRLLLDFIRKGDTLYVTRLDRLARSMADFCRIVDELEKKGAHLQCTQQPINTATSEGRLLVNMLGAFAQFENEIRRERQMADIAAAKTKGKYKGRSKSFDPAKILAMVKAHPEMTKWQIAQEIGCDRTTVHRTIKEAADASAIR